MDLMRNQRTTRGQYERQTDMIGTLEGGEDEFVDRGHKDQKEKPNDKPVHVNATNN